MSVLPVSYNNISQIAKAYQLLFTTKPTGKAKEALIYSIENSPTMLVQSVLPAVFSLPAHCSLKKSRPVSSQTDSVPGAPHGPKGYTA
jgi:hypothetical protein